MKKVILKNIILISHIILILITSLHAVAFNIIVNETRITNDMYYKNIGESFSSNSSLKFMKFYVPKKYMYSREDLENLIEFLKASGDNFFILGDTSILYGLSKKPSVNPSLWFHYGLTVPNKNTGEFKLFESQMMKNIFAYEVRYVVIEGDRTCMGIKLEDFTKLDLLIKDKSLSTYTFGGFKVFELN